MTEGLKHWRSLKEEKLSNGNTIYYVELNGTHYEVGIKIGDKELKEYKQVDDSLLNTLEALRQSRRRVRVWYGDKDTGRAWLEEFDVTGTIGRSTGSIKIPILVNNKRSWGGGALSVGSIVRIDDIATHTIRWKHENFRVEKLELQQTEICKDYPYSVMQTKDTGAVENVANFKTEEQAKRWISFMTGDSYRK